MEIHSTATLRSLIENHLNALIPKPTGPFSLLYEAARYSLFLPGKRLRPLFLLSVLQDYGIPIEKGLDAAAALEMIHTYSLIHDDLPCMDNQDIRKGNPTLHTLYGEGHAVLVGDFLLTSAFEILGHQLNIPQVSALIAKRAGGKGLIGGQVIDLFAEKNPIDRKTLFSMYLGKTAALFSAALECGALISGASSSAQKAFRAVGKYFGVAYQIWDDILDYTEEKKTNCLTLYSRNQAKECAHFFQKKALSLVPKEAHHVQTQMLSSFSLTLQAAKSL